MKVAATSNLRKHSESAYNEVSTVFVTKHSSGRVFCLHRSYNPLMSCYMLSDYKTGRIFTAFGFSKFDLKESDVDRLIARANTYLENLDITTLNNTIDKMPVVNKDDIELSNDADYSDVKLIQRIKESKEKALEEKIKGEALTKTAKKKPTPDSKPKRKRGRPPKKKPDDDVTLI